MENLREQREAVMAWTFSGVALSCRRSWRGSEETTWSPPLPSARHGRAPVRDDTESHHGGHSRAIPTRFARCANCARAAHLSVTPRSAPPGVIGRCHRPVSPLDVISRRVLRILGSSDPAMMSGRRSDCEDQVNLDHLRAARRDKKGSACRVEGASPSL